MSDNKTILIIDDDNRNIFALSAVLRSRGYTITSAPSAQEGIDIMKKNQGIKMVLMDIMMPDMDGYEAIAQIRNDKDIAAIPIIAVTAHAMVGDREKTLEAGADAYISKPIDIDKLVNLLKNYNL